MVEEQLPQERHRHDAVLAAIARIAGASLELEDVLDRIAEQAARLTGADRASIWLLDRAGLHLMPSALFGMDPEFTAAWKRRPLDVSAEPLSREAIETGRPVVVRDAPADPRTDKASVAFFGDRSILVAPLVRRGRTLGTLFLNHVRQRYDFSADDVATTVAIASQAAVVIDNARLYRDTRRRADQLRRFFRRASEALTTGIQSEGTLRRLIALAVETVDADGGSITLLDETGRGSYVAATAGTTAPPAEGILWEAPLRVEGTPRGALRFWREAPPFEAEERELMESFAGHVRAAIEHHHLYAGLQDERERARLAERTKAEFVSMVTHELRTPLALIKGYVSTLLQPSLGLGPDVITRFLEGIDSAADRLRRLIDNLLSVTAMETSVFMYQPRPVNVEPIVRSAVAEVSLLAQGRPIEVEMAGADLWLLADADQLVQVLENLLNNALKYAPGSSPVRVRAARHGQHIRISVQDSGPGIPPEALDLIFEKFYRVKLREESDTAPLPAGAGHEPSSDGARRGGGLGLGLFICRRIVETHGGRIWAENVDGGGAAFHIDLPAILGDAQPPNSVPDMT